MLGTDILGLQSIHSHYSLAETSCALYPGSLAAWLPGSGEPQPPIANPQPPAVMGDASGCKSSRFRRPPQLANRVLYKAVCLMCLSGDFRQTRRPA